MSSKTIILLVATILGVAQSAHSNGWRQVLSCDNGAAVLDTRKNGYQEEVQLVIRHREIAEYLYREQFIEMSERGEGLIQIRADQVEIEGGLETASYNYRRSQPVVYRLRREGSQLAFDVFRASSPSGGLHIKHERIGGWLFSHCRD